MRTPSHWLLLLALPWAGLTARGAEPTAAAGGGLRGNPGDILEQFQFENVTITAKKPNWPANTVKEFSLRQVTVNGQPVATPKEKP